jgi:O-antigen ligase
LSTVTSPGEVTQNSRFEIWEDSLPMVGASPWLGVGEGNYSEESPRFGLLDIGGLHYDHAHNLLLTIAIETGLVGLAFFVAFLWGTARAAGRALRGGRRDVYSLALGMTAALVGLFVTSFGEYPPRTNAILATTMIEVGLLVACARLSRPAPPGAGDDRPQLPVGRGGRAPIGPSGRRRALAG